MTTSDTRAIPPGMVAWSGGAKPADWDGKRVMFRSGKVMDAPIGAVWKLGWDHSYGDGDVIAYTSTRTPASPEASIAGEVTSALLERHAREHGFVTLNWEAPEWKAGPAAIGEALGTPMTDKTEIAAVRAILQDRADYEREEIPEGARDTVFQRMLDIIDGRASLTAGGAEAVRVRTYGDEAERHLALRSPLNRAIYEAVREYRLSNMSDQDGSCGYPLVDLMSNPAPCDIGTGELEMVALVDEIESAVLAFPIPATPTAHDAAIGGQGEVERGLADYLRAVGSVITPTERTVAMAAYQAGWSDAGLAALPPVSDTGVREIPDGYVLVPVEPTEAMAKAPWPNVRVETGIDSPRWMLIQPEHARAVWSAMIAAAPARAALDGTGEG